MKTTTYRALARGRAAYCAALFVVLLTISTASWSELTQVTVGGEVRIRGHYWQNVFNDSNQPLMIAPELRWSKQHLSRRPIGDVIGGACVYSYRDWDGRGADFKGVQQRTSLHVRADFTENVTEFIELDAYNYWGEDFRSNYVTGTDFRGTSLEDVEVYQAYIEAREVYGTPLRLRIGRQELEFGNQWLVGNNARLPEFTMLSFDALRLTYATERLTVDGFWAKLAENGPVEEDGDIDFAGLYASYAFCPAFTLDGYWLLVRDARAIADPANIFAPDAPSLLCGDYLIAALLDNDDYSVTYLNTVGLRATGTSGGFDYAAEAAYQFGPADQIGSLFRRSLVGDDGAEFDAWAAHAEAGYTFDVRWKPRIYVRGAYFDGEDNRDISFLEWLNPFTKPEASISFNRLFSDVTYSDILDNMAQMSNFWTVQAGVTVKPTDQLSVQLQAAHFSTVDTFESPLHYRWRRTRVLFFSNYSFFTEESSADMGWESALTLAYHYSNDLVFRTGWTHLFTGDGLYDGNYSDLNGLLFNGGTDSDDADYFYVETAVCF